MSERRTIKQLIRDLHPAGEAYAWVPIRTKSGNPIQHRLRLHKTELIEGLKLLDPYEYAYPYAVHEWDWTSGGGYLMRARAIYLNDATGDVITPRAEKYGVFVGKPVPTGG